MRTLFLFLVLGFALSVTSKVYATEAHLRLSLLSFYPFGGKSADGQIEGIYWDVAQALQKRSGLKIDVNLLPISRAIRSISDGSADLIVASASPQLSQDAVSLGVIGCSRIIVQTSRAAEIGSLDDLKDKPIAFVTKGFLYRAYGDKFGLNPIQTNTSQSMFTMLDRGRVDGIFISDIVLDAYIKSGFVTPFVSKNWLEKLGPRIEVRSVPAHLHLSKTYKNEAVKNVLIKALELERRAGTFEKVYSSYGVQSRGRCQGVPAPERGQGASNRKLASIGEATVF